MLQRTALIKCVKKALPLCSYFEQFALPAPTEPGLKAACARVALKSEPHRVLPGKLGEDMSLLALFPKDRTNSVQLHIFLKKIRDSDSCCQVRVEMTLKF